MVFSVEFADQFLTLSTILPGTESLYGLGEHKVSLKLKKLVVPKFLHIQVFNNVRMHEHLSRVSQYEFTVCTEIFVVCHFCGFCR